MGFTYSFSYLGGLQEKVQRKYFMLDVTEIVDMAKSTTRRRVHLRHQLRQLHHVPRHHLAEAHVSCRAGRSVRECITIEVGSRGCVRRGLGGAGGPVRGGQDGAGGPVRGGQDGAGGGRGHQERVLAFVEPAITAQCPIQIMFAF